MMPPERVVVNRPNMVPALGIYEMGVRVPTSISIRLGLILPSRLLSRLPAIMEPAVSFIKI